MSRFKRDLTDWGFWLECAAIVWAVEIVGIAWHLTIGTMFVILLAAGLIWGICRATPER